VLAAYDRVQNLLDQMSQMEPGEAMDALESQLDDAMEEQRAARAADHP